MELNPPIKVRIALYIISTIATPIVTYLAAKDILGEPEVILCGAILAIISGIAVRNTINFQKKD